MKIAFYFKELHKSWLTAVIPIFLMSSFILLFINSWPAFKADINSYLERFNLPFYQTLFGSGIRQLNLATFQGALGMYMFVFSEMLLVFLSIFLGVNIVTREIDKHTLDTVLSYPFPRWQFIIQKFAVYNTYTFFLVFSILIEMPLSAMVLRESFNSVALFQALVGLWMLFFTLGAIALLCGTMFLETYKSYGAATIIIGGMWMLDRLGSVIINSDIIQSLSIFHYLNGGAILATGVFPLDQAVIIGIVGLIAFISSLYIFQNRELPV